MAATGFTPIQLYRTTTASAQPSAGNLADGELAINLTDKKLYAKDASNNVFVLADASSGGTTATNLAGGAAGSVPYQTGANATTFLGIGTAAQVLQVNSGATAPEWVNTSGTGDVARTTSPSFTTPSLGAATALSINSLTLTTSTGTFTLANGKTLTVNNSLTLSGTDATTMTFPSTSATIARTDAAQSFTGTQTFLSNPVLDAGTANGVLYLDGSKVVTSGSALTFDGSTFSNVQGSGTAALSFNQLNFSRNGANYLTATLSSLNYGASQHIFGNNDLSSEWMRLTSTGLGIGTDNPTNALSVTGNANITGNTTLGNASTDTVQVNGYMGVGSAPNSARLLGLTGSGGFSGTTQIGLSSLPTGTSAGTVALTGVSVLPITATAVYTVADVINFGAYGVTKGAGSTITNQHGVYIADQTQGTNNYGITSLVSSGTNKWNIYASGTAANYFAGNVGIGTNNPIEKLTVSGSAAFSRIGLNANAIDIVSTAQSFARFQTTGGDFYIGTEGSVGGVFFPGSTAYAAVLYNASSTPMQFYTAGTLRATLDSSGNLGIGTTTFSTSDWFSSVPKQVISILANLALRLHTPTASSGVGIAGLSFAANDASAAQKDIAVIRGETTAADAGAGVIQFLTRASGGSLTERLEIGTTGAVFNDVGEDYDFRVESDTNTHALFVDAGNSRVGVGTSVPSQIFAVNNPTATADVAIGFMTSGIERSYINQNGNSGAFTINAGYAGYGGALFINTNGVQRLSIGNTGNVVFNEDGVDADFRVESDTNTHAFFLEGSSGNVGIGTSSPGFKLDVSGAGTVYGSIGNTTSGSGSARLRLFNSGDTSDGFALINNAGASGQVNILNYKNSPLAFWTNSTERARIDSSGNLIQTVNTTAATLTTNQTLTFSIVDNSTLRISVRGSDGTTRTATVALT